MSWLTVVLLVALLVLEIVLLRLDRAVDSELRRLGDGIDSMERVIRDLKMKRRPDG